MTPSSAIPSSPNPTEDPTAIPTHHPSEQSQSGRRLLKQVENTYSFIVDGFNTTLEYGYDAAYTTIVRSIYPAKISSGCTTNVSFLLDNYGSNFVEKNVSVIIGEQACNQVNQTSFGFLSCVLLRNASATTVVTDDVKIYIEGDGYASSSILNQLPTVERGFELFTSKPMNGIVLGGNIITIDGFGFDIRNPLNHIVQFSEVGLIPYTSYDALLLSLGFNAYSKRSADQVLNCTILALNFTQIQCQLAPHVAVYTNNTYIISVTLNNIMATSTANLTYDQNMLYTPTLSGDLQISSQTSKGEYEFTVSGTLLAAGKLTVAVGHVLCSVSHIADFSTYQQITVVTPPLTAGTWPVYANVSGKGVALSYASITVGNYIESALFDTPSGSIAGGTVLKIRGYGFSSDCEKNVVLFATAASEPLSAYEYVTCLPHEMVLRTPAALGHFSASSQSSLSLSSLLTYLVGNDSVVASKAFSTSPFSYSLANTPLIISNRSSGYGGLPLKVFVDDRSTLNTDNITVSVGGKACFDPTSHSRTHQILTDNYDVEVECTLPYLTASSVPYDVVVDLYPVGYAVINSSYYSLPKFTSLLEATPFDTIRSSIFGGLKIPFDGKGFSKQVSVSVCDRQCEIGPVSSTGTNFSCTSPTHLTLQAVKDVQYLGLIDHLIGSVSEEFFSSSAPDVGELEALSDGNYETFTEFPGKSCRIGIQIPDGYLVTPYRMRFYPELRRSAYFDKVSFEGSVDGVTYSSLGQTSSIHEGWNFINATTTADPQWYRYLRLRIDDTSKTSRCALAELDFLGIVAATSDTCPIVVSSNLTNSDILVGSVQYESLVTFTPVVTDISPNNGTAIGGTLVTITGDNLLPLDSVFGDGIQVLFSGVSCAVVRSNLTTIQCITGHRSPYNIEVSNITVWIPGRGYAAVNKSSSFLYIDKWSALTSWKYQEPPVEGDIVWIPDGQVILLDTNTPILTFLLIEGALYFDRSKDLTVDAFYIFVHGGYMEVGTADRPFEKSATITLHGDRYKTIEVPPIGSKCLAVADKGVPAASFDIGEHQPGRHHSIPASIRQADTTVNLKCTDRNGYAPGPK